MPRSPLHCGAVTALGQDAQRIEAPANEYAVKLND